MAELSPNEASAMRSLGLRIFEKCDRCGEMLNQTLRYTIARKTGVFCSPDCRDRACFGEDALELASKRRTCLHCRGPKPASESPYCLSCQNLAYPAEMTPQQKTCAVCGGQVSGFRRSRTG